MLSSAFLSALSFGQSILLLIVLAVLSFCYFFIYVPLKITKFYTDQGLPASSFRPVLGNIPEIQASDRDDDPGRVSRELAKKYGKSVITYFGPRVRFVTHDPDILQEVLIKKAQYYRKPASMVTALEPLLGHGLLINEGESWKRQRSLISPAFHFVNIKRMTSLMVESSVEAYAKWEKGLMSSKPVGASANTSPSPVTATDGSFVVEIHQAFSALTLDIIASTSFGSTFKRDPHLADVLYYTFNELLHLIQKRNWSVFGLLPILRWIPVPLKLAINRQIAEVRGMVYKLVTERRTGINTSLCEGKDLLDLLLEAREVDGSGMSEELLRDELMTFVLAGHETTSNLMSWMFYLLATHPDVLARCVAEVDKELNGAAPTSENMKGLVYCDATIDESLRFFPPAPFIARQALEDHEIGSEESGMKPIKIKKGTGISIQVRLLHRDPKLWPDPDTFRPERFLDKTVKRHPMAFLPFAAGPRACIGAQFARLEAKVMMACLLQRFNLELVPGQKIAPFIAITMRPKYGVLIKFAPRKVLPPQASVS